MAEKRREVTFGLVGVAGFGWQLAKAIIAQAPEVNCRLVAAADMRFDQVPDRVEALKAHGAVLYSDAFEMFDAWQGRCDAMYIAAGISSHEPLTIAAVQRGYHVHVEKPPAGTVQEVDRMIDAVDRSGRLAMVGFQAVHSPDIRFMKERIVDGRLGKIKRIVCYALEPRTADYYARNEWAGKVRVAGKWVLDGPATNAAIHEINNMMLLASSLANEYAHPTAIEAELYRAGPIESYDTSAMRIQTSEGVEVLFLVTHCSNADMSAKMEIQAERGTVSWQMWRGARFNYSDGTSEEINPTGGKPAWGQSYAAEVSDFVDAIRTGDRSLLGCQLAQGRRSILIINGAFDASGTIQQIDPKYTRRVDDGTDKARTVIEGIDEATLEAARRFCLYSELGSLPWTRPAGRMDLVGYNQFPQRYKA